MVVGPPGYGGHAPRGPYELSAMMEWEWPGEQAGEYTSTSESVED